MHPTLISLLSLTLLTLTHAGELSPPKDPKAWAEWAEKLHPISDPQGHSPDIGSQEWLAALDRKLAITDKNGHGPDLGSEEWRHAVEKKLKNNHRILLSSHTTLATLTSITDHRCLGLTTLCPDQCGHSGKLASFQIIKYLSYEKPGQYGDPKQETFQLLIEDNLGNAKIPAPILEKITTLKPGTEVHLTWNHHYITKDGSQFPERTIVKLEPTQP